MFVQSRKLKVFTAAGYLLVVVGVALFHDHHACDDDHAPRGYSVSHSDDRHDCFVCQFLAQKPTPTADITPVGTSSLVQNVAAPAPLHAAGAIFAAWHSRAPPVLA